MTHSAEVAEVADVLANRRAWAVPCGDSLAVLRTFPAACVSVAVTSPPYWMLRDYGTGKWVGGDPACKHKRANARPDHSLAALTGTRGGQGSADAARTPMAGVCSKCGAVREDAQLGLEPLHDCAGWATGAPCGSCYVCHLVAVFREVRRVLHPSGTLWLNLGDSYSNGVRDGDTYGREKVGPKGSPHADKAKVPLVCQRCGFPFEGAVGRRFCSQACGGVDNTPRAGWRAPKNLLMIPARVALALQADGWVLRNEVVWMKKSPMPMSVRDRMTCATERVYLLAARGRYFYDQEAERVALAECTPNDGRLGKERERDYEGTAELLGEGLSPSRTRATGGAPGDESGRNLWDYWLDTADLDCEEIDEGGEGPPDAWLLGSEPQRHSHYAAFPSAVPRRAVRLGSSERGVCPECHAPWVRQVQRRQRKRERPNDHVKRSGEDGTGNACANTAAGAEVRTLGWAPTCGHGREPVPALILDPFCGSGVTGKVAREEGRRFVGIDLSPKYCKLARGRVGSVAPLFD